MKRKNILLFFIVTALFGFSMYCNITFKAQAEQTNEDLNTPAELSAAFIDSFTDTDNLKNNSLCITDYKDTLFNRNVTCHRGYLSVKEGVSDDKKFHIESSGDDDIVNIIPRDLFKYRGDYFYIGKEYAYFVRTEAFNNYNNTNTSIVMVIDITTHFMDDEKYIDFITQEIHPLFCYKYAYISKSDGYVLPYYDCGNHPEMAYTVARVPDGLRI